MHYPQLKSSDDGEADKLLSEELALISSHISSHGLTQEVGILFRITQVEVKCKHVSFLLQHVHTIVTYCVPPTNRHIWHLRPVLLMCKNQGAI